MRILKSRVRASVCTKEGGKQPKQNTELGFLLVSMDEGADSKEKRQDVIYLCLCTLVGPSTLEQCFILLIIALDASSCQQVFKFRKKKSYFFTEKHILHSLSSSLNAFLISFT